MRSVAVAAASGHLTDPMVDTRLAQEKNWQVLSVASVLRIAQIRIIFA